MFYKTDRRQGAAHGRTDDYLSERGARSAPSKNACPCDTATRAAVICLARVVGATPRHCATPLTDAFFGESSRLPGESHKTVAPLRKIIHLA